MVINNQSVLTEDQIDLFKELINIAYGRAAGLLYEFTEVEIHLDIPEVNFLTQQDFAEMLSLAAEDSLVISQQSFRGKIAGETLMAFSRQEATKLSQLLNQIQDVSEGDVLSAVYEVGNIITTTSTQVLTEITNVQIMYDKPDTDLFTKSDLELLVQNINYDQIFSITTRLTIPDADVNAKIFYLFYRESIQLLAQSLQY